MFVQNHGSKRRNSRFLSFSFFFKRFLEFGTSTCTSLSNIYAKLSKNDIFEKIYEHIFDFAVFVSGLGTMLLQVRRGRGGTISPHTFSKIETAGGPLSCLLRSPHRDPPCYVVYVSGGTATTPTIQQ